MGPISRDFRGPGIAQGPRGRAGTLRPLTQNPYQPPSGNPGNVMGGTAPRPPNWNRPVTDRSAGELLNQPDDVGGPQSKAFARHLRRRARAGYTGASDRAVKEARRDLGEDTS